MVISAPPLSLPRGLYVGLKLNQLIIQRGKRKIELVRVLKADRNSAGQRLRGRRVNLHIRLKTDLRISSSDRGAGNYRRVSDAILQSRIGQKGSDLIRIQLGSLQGLSYPGRDLIRRERSISAEGARRRGGGSRSFARGMSNGGVDVISSPEPVDSKQQHEHQGEYDRGLGNFGSAAVSRCAFPESHCGQSPHACLTV